MTSPDAMTPAEHERGARILHAILAAGVAIILALFVRNLQLAGPVMAPGAARPIVAYVASGIGVIGILAATMVLRPPARQRLRDAPADNRRLSAPCRVA